MNYYDITFHELSGKTVIKRNVPSEKAGFEAWQDACAQVTEKEIQLLVNDGTYVTMNRQFIVRIDAEEVKTQLKKHSLEKMRSWVLSIPCQTWVFKNDGNRHVSEKSCNHMLRFSLFF